LIALGLLWRSIVNSIFPCIHVIVQEHAARRPEATALMLGDERLSYGELDRRANRLAHHLRPLGVGPETCVAVQLERSFELVIALLAVLKAGAAYLPLDPGIPDARRRYMLQAAGALAVITQASLADHAPDVDPVPILLDEDASAIAARPSSHPPEGDVTPENLAYITFTSGSTGRPKGSLIPHRSVPGFVLGASYMRIEPDDVFLQHSSVLWDALTLELWTPLLCGAGCALLHAHRPGVGEIAAAVVRYGVTTLWLSAGLFNVLLDEAPEALAGLRRLLIGGEALSLPHVRRALEILPNTELINGYGPSECTVFSTCHPIPRELRPDLRAVPIGRPVGDRKVHLLDANMRRVPIGVPGEIYVGGPAVARGYVGQPALTARSFVPDPFGGDGARLYRTGDFARLLPDGTLEFVGRRDDQIKLRGFRVELGEIEAQLKAHPRVREAACLCSEAATGQRDIAAGGQIVAYVVPETGEGGDDGAAEQVASWEQVFDETIYSTGSMAADPLFNTAGWRSSYDGSAIPVEEMRAWADDIVGQARRLQPCSILEIGCGNGMLLLQLARGCEAYVGTDVSRTALDYVTRQVELHRPDYGHVRLLRQPATDFTGIEPASIDVVVLSSVVQYFPSIDYLLQVLDGCFGILRPGGSVFFGDLRSLPLAEAFHGSVQLAKAEATSTVGELRRRIRQHVAQDTELFIDPALFPALRRRYPSVGDVRIRLQRGRAHNELTRFRYSALLSTRPSPSEPTLKPISGIDSTAEIETLLRERPEHLLLTDLINARLVTDLGRLERLARADANDTIAFAAAQSDDAPDGVDPESVARLAAEHGYGVELAWSVEGLGRFDAALTRRDTVAPALPPLVLRREPPRAWQAYASRPLQANGNPSLPAALRRHLGERLPDYMIPSAFVLLDRLPLTRNGKLDRRALTAIETAGPGAEQSYVEPRSALERVLASHYAELLGVERVGIHDNFFDLGGHSLLATRLASRVRKTLKVDLPLRSLFEEPTVAGLACLLAGREPVAGQTERIAELVLRVAELPPDEVRRMLQERRGT
jgi:amino acid adenylation domain-containing protein